MEEETTQESQMNQLLQNLEDLRQLMVQNLQIKDELIDRLHRDLEYYQRGSAEKYENQLLKAVIQIRHRMRRALSDGRLADLTAAQMLREYQNVFEELTDLLELQNCDEIVSASGDSFDATIHQAKIAYTDDPGLDKTVKQSLAPGYWKGNKVLLPERVLVYQYKQA